MIQVQNKKLILYIDEIMNNSTTLIKSEDTFQNFLDYLKNMKESRLEEVADGFLLLVQVKNYQFFCRLTPIQYAFLILTIQFFLAIVAGLIVRKSG